MKEKKKREEELMNKIVEKVSEEKITTMSDIREIIQKTIKEKGLDPVKVAKELNPRNNG